MIAILQHKKITISSKYYIDWLMPFCSHLCWDKSEKSLFPIVCSQHWLCFAIEAISLYA